MVFCSSDAPIAVPLWTLAKYKLETGQATVSYQSSLLLPFKDLGISPIRLKSKSDYKPWGRKFKVVVYMYLTD